MKTAQMEVTLIDHMGTDLTVVNAARVSFDKESEWGITHSRRPDGSLTSTETYMLPTDVKLINYLARNNHWTPFGHCFLQFRIKAPIFVARQLVKHQVGLVWNEVSRRYVDSEPEFWFPEVWRGRPEGSMKQGSSDKDLTLAPCSLDGVEGPVAEVAETVAAVAWDAYSSMIASGVAPEQARMVLPQNTMTEWYWSGSLAAFARVCKLRLDPHAQEETREVAKLIDDHASLLFPVSWKALMEDV